MGSQNILYQSASVFSLVTTPEPVRLEREILVIIDKGSKKKKWPGGGVEGEDLDAAAGIELLEETGLRGFRREAVLVETHKISQENANEIHKDIFFLSCPIAKSEPTPGEDIAYAAWEPVSDVMRQVQKRGFVPNHASAFIWWLVRDEFLKTGNRNLLYHVLSDNNSLSIGIRQSTLILCFAHTCAECAEGRKSGGMVTPAVFGQNYRFRTEEKIDKIDGKIYFIIYSGNRFDDFVLFQPTRTEGVFLLPRRILEKPLGVEDVPHYAAKNFGGEFTIIGCKKIGVVAHEHVVVLRLHSSLEGVHLTPVCVSKPPHLNFAMSPETWQAFNAAVPLLEAYSFAMDGENHMAAVNRLWKSSWRDRVPKYIPREEGSVAE
ncbi:MAG: NUDIX domain-containing protein [Candidatus Sungbacteria bacterium]|nr:NUDIX domain-containing protein [Candidatus Sungbacteria bacterium]